jgi:hypothetical protein
MQRPSLVILHVAKGVTAHFDTRVTEWMMGAALGGWGLNLLSPDVSFSFAPAAWQGLLAVPFMGTEERWAWLCIALGATRWVALLLNGSFPDQFYSRWSPNVRALSALLGAAFWFEVAMSVASIPSPGRLTYLLPLGLEIWCVFHAGRDTGRAKAKRDAQL